ncbi:hypothetical protein KTJ59_14825 [Acinetobacter baumannii]|nr:hypothetical protein [Acinetobacter baumannii]
MLKPIIILVAIGAIGLVGYKVFAQKDEPTQINETVLLINDANKSVEEADHTRLCCTNLSVKGFSAI